MQQHPVPQNISGFEFKLVGLLTLKQFGYIAAAGVLGFILYYSPFPGFIKLLLIVIVALSGIALALVPINDIPLDRWIVVFIKSVYSPTKRIWKKDKKVLEFLGPTYSQYLKSITKPGVPRHPADRKKLEVYLARLRAQRYRSPLDFMEDARLSNLKQNLGNQWQEYSEKSGFPQDLTFKQPTRTWPPPPVQNLIRQAKNKISQDQQGRNSGAPEITSAAPGTPEFPADLPPTHIKFPGQALPGRFNPLLHGRLIEQSTASATKIAGEVSFKPAATIAYPEKNLYIKPLTYLRARPLKPPPYFGDLLLPIRGEKTFELTPEFKANLERRIQAKIDDYQRPLLPPEILKEFQSTEQPEIEDKSLLQIPTITQAPEKTETQERPLAPSPLEPISPPVSQSVEPGIKPPSIELPIENPTPTVERIEAPLEQFVEKPGETPTVVIQNEIKQPVIETADLFQKIAFLNTKEQLAKLTGETDNIKIELESLRKGVLGKDARRESLDHSEVLSKLDRISNSLETVTSWKHDLEKVISTHNKTLEEIEKENQTLSTRLSKLKKQLVEGEAAPKKHKEVIHHQKHILYIKKKPDEPQILEKKKEPHIIKSASLLEPVKVATPIAPEIENEILEKATKEKETSTTSEKISETALQQMKEQIESAKEKIVTLTHLPDVKHLPEEEREELMHRLQSLKNETEVLRQYDEIKQAKEKRRINSELAGILNQLEEKPAAATETQIPSDEAGEKRLPLTPSQKAAAIAEIKRLEEQAVKKTGLPPIKTVVKPRLAVGKMAPSLVSSPNVINGIVKDRFGLLVDNVILVVKDSSGDPVRALKTNKIGQFAISTPLPNGVYTIDLEKEGYQFDIVEVEITGQVMPPIEIRSH